MLIKHQVTNGHLEHCQKEEGYCCLSLVSFARCKLLPPLVGALVDDPPLQSSRLERIVTCMQSVLVAAVVYGLHFSLETFGQH
jgi:hypothetical protein